jgi:hypothetical protein
MNFGYLIFVSYNDKVDYDRLSYALALSIKNTQKEGYDKVALVIDDKSRLEKFKSIWVFDKIIEWDKETYWDGRSWMDVLSPWDYTVCLDADMLFFENYSHWIDYFIENSELYIANRSYTYRGEIVESDVYRKTFTKNDLPNLYSFYTFFKKDSLIADDFFKLARYITKNPREFSNLFLSDYKPRIVGTDEAFALSAKILDISDEISYDLEFPKVVHLKPDVQNWPWSALLVSDHIGFYFDRYGKLKLGNYQQHNIVHYVEKEKLTTEIISILEEIAWKKNT